MLLEGTRDAHIQGSSRRMDAEKIFETYDRKKLTFSKYKEILKSGNKNTAQESRGQE